MVELETFKKSLTMEFEVKDLGQMRYFSGIEIAESKKESVFHNINKFLIFYLK